MLTYSSCRKLSFNCKGFKQLSKPTEDNVVPSHAVCIIEEKPRQALAEKKSLLHLHKDVKLAYLAKITYELEGRELKELDELDQAEVDAGAFELLWRLAPRRAIALPATFVEEVLAALVPAEDVPLAASFLLGT